MDDKQREALRRLLRRVDEVRGLEVVPPDGGGGETGEETDLLLRTAESLVDELERSRRRLIETNVQLVSLREVAHSMVSSNESEEATQTVTTYLHKAFGFEDVFLGLIHREEGVLEGSWTRKTGGSHATLPFRVPLLGAPESVVVKSVWQHRPFVIHDARLHPPFTAAADSTLADVLELVDGYAVVPLQRSRTVLVDARAPRTPATATARSAPPARAPGTRRRTPTGRGRRTASARGGAASTARSSRSSACSAWAAAARSTWHRSRPRCSSRSRCRSRPWSRTRGCTTSCAAPSASASTCSTRCRTRSPWSTSTGRILTFNRSAVELLGLSEDEARTRPIEQVLGVDAARLLRQTLAGGREHQRVETTLPRRISGTRTSPTPVEGALWAAGGAGVQAPTVQVMLSTSLLRNERRSVYGVIATFVDQSRVKVMEERIRQLDRLAALGRFTSSVAHEIRNPLAGIAAGAQYLKKSIPPGHADHENFKFILSEIARLDRIVEDLFHITHPKSLQPSRRRAARDRRSRAAVAAAADQGRARSPSSGTSRSACRTCGSTRTRCSRCSST